ncbi:sensor histidine kinase [Hamadaea tsunoensis]|uniref:sensor histidine kinase n=1 Tax=Hamadaea tsunoensis TaxID=53368 RepID=UPI00041CFD9A|nr:nitrate- and nitrite sensing domain-containing protein [Hamadaea tsunoensis]
MTGRPARLRTKIIAVLVSLIALWTFAAYVTIGQGLRVVLFATLENQVAKPTEAALNALQNERRASAAYIALAGASAPETAAGAAALAAQKDQLGAARRDTDQKAAELRAVVVDRLNRLAETAEGQARLGDLLRGFESLPAERFAVDAGRVGRAEATGYFTDLLRIGWSVYDTFTLWDDNDVIFQTSTIQLITQSQEMISQEDALLAAVLGSRRLTAADRAEFTRLVGAQRNLAGTASDRMNAEQRARYAAVLTGQSMTDLVTIEELVMRAEPGPAPQVTADAWRDTTRRAIEAHRQLAYGLGDLLVGQLAPKAIWVLVRLALAAGLGLVAVIFSIRFTIRALRSLQDQLSALRVAALDLAHERLPKVVDRLRLGEQVDVDSAAPRIAFGADDIGEVAAAFDAVRQTAIQATVDQAELRRGVRDIFLNLAHRIQGLVHRQLKIIDAMERRAATDEELADLYRIDHLATRMRRNAENLIVLSGASAGRGWRTAVPMVDVIRAALAEVEDYPRIQLHAIEPAALSGRAVGDLTHLIAELLENAVSFSPPRTPVVVIGTPLRTGYLVQIEDRGLGMTDEALADANRQIADPPELNLSSTTRLGFYVVGRLARRHDVRVRLQGSAYQGVTASVLVPLELLTAPADPDEPTLPELPASPWPAEAEPVAIGSGPIAAEPAAYTPGGLPMRVRRNVPAPRLSAEPEPEDARTPDDVARLLSAYLSAAHSGRAHAEQAGPSTEGPA